MMKMVEDSCKKIDDFVINQRRFGSKVGLGYTTEGESSKQVEWVNNNQHQKPKMLACYHCGKPRHTSNVCRSKAQGKPKVAPKFNGYYYYCGKFGHQAYECTKKLNENPNNPTMEKPCYTCNKHGHTSQECKAKKKQV